MGVSISFYHECDVNNYNIQSILTTLEKLNKDLTSAEIGRVFYEIGDYLEVGLILKNAKIAYSFHLFNRVAAMLLSNYSLPYIEKVSISMAFDNDSQNKEEFNNIAGKFKLTIDDFRNNTTKEYTKGDIVYEICPFTKPKHYMELNITYLNSMPTKHFGDIVYKSLQAVTPF